MKKLLCFVLALMTVALPFGAGAEAEGPLSALFQAGCSLLFSTHNVTLTGTAEFTFNGTVFKSCDAKYIQDGTDSFWQLKLHTPRAGKPVLETGYTVFGSGSDVVIMEDYQPGAYWMNYKIPEDSILRPSAATALLVPAAGQLIAWAEPALSGALTEEKTAEGGRRLTLSLPDGVPAQLDTLLNLGMSFVLNRYFHINMDSMPSQGGAGWADYLTRAEALKYWSRKAALERAELTAETDAAGDLTRAAGSAEIRVTGADGDTVLVGVTFDITAGGRGESHVTPFDPKDWGVGLNMPAEGWEVFQVTGDERLAELHARSAACWLGAGQALPLPGRFEAEYDAGAELSYYAVLYEYADGVGTQLFLFDGEDRLLTMENLLSPFGDGMAEGFADVEPDSALSEQALAFVASFLDAASPARPVEPEDLQITGQKRSADGEEYLILEAADTIVILRVQPEMRIESFSCIHNG